MSKGNIMTIQYLTDDDRWNAVAQRDRQANGVFFYAVKTTGVFCRPTCRSRLPNRANVEFFPTCKLAERGGYRACKKCNPKAGNALPDTVIRACRMIEQADEPPSLGALAKAVRLSPFYFHKLFKSVVGVTPKAYSAARRIEKFRAGLRQDQTVTAAMYDAGFGSSSRCYESVGNNLGMTPTEFRSGGAGQSIRFAVVKCRLGWVAVAATVRGICLIEFGDAPDSLRAVTAARFPNATLHKGDAEFNGWVKLVVRQIEMPASVVELPLDVQGTAFQRKVWEALKTIPAGATTTYAAIAKNIGHPAAVRAVANACAANPVAVVVPCHRVLRSDGHLSGYRWGIGRKRLLLDNEAAES